MADAIDDFRSQYGDAAARAGQQLGVHPDLVLAQWGVETGWGKSVIPGTNNLGNIMDFSGGGVEATDRQLGRRDKYKAYKDVNEFADDYVRLIMSGGPKKLYRDAVGAGEDPGKFYGALKAGGYMEQADAVKVLTDAYTQLRTRGSQGSPVSWSSTQYVPPVGDAEQRTATVKAGETAPDLWTGLKDAFNTETSIGWFHDGWNSINPDPNWKLSFDKLKEDTKDIDPRYIPMLGDSVSQAHYNELLQKAKSDQEARQRLAALGWTGVGLTTIANIADPANIVAELATLGLATPEILAARLGRIGTRVLEGLKVGASNAAIEAFMAGVNPNHSMNDVLWAGLTGLALGTAIGPLGRPHEAIREPVERFAAKAQAEADKRAAQNTLDNVRATAPEIPVPQSLSAAASGIGINTPNLLPGADMLAKIFDDAPETAFGKLRFSMSGQMGSSENGIVRALGDALVQDAVGKKDNSVIGFAASEWMREQSALFEARYARFRHDAYNEWLKDQYGSGGMVNRWSHAGEFNDLVSKAVRNTDPNVTFHPAVQRLAKVGSDIQRDLLELAKNPGKHEGIVMQGLHGADKIDPNVNYVTRQYSAYRMNGLIERHGENTLSRLFAQAFLDAHPTASVDLAKKVGYGMLKTIQRAKAGMEADYAHAFSGADTRRLAHLLRDSGTLSDQEIDGILSLMRKREETGSVPLKQRVLLNEKASITAPNGETVSFEDMLNNDFDMLLSRYIHSMTGQIALARVRLRDPKTGDLLVDGIRSEGDWKDMLDKVRAVGAEKRMDPKKIERDIANLNAAYASIRGIPAPGEKHWQDVARLIGKFNYVRVMNQVGFAQISEFGVLMGEAGWRAAMTHMPALKRIRTMSGEEILKDGLGRELEAAIGTGTEHLRGVFPERWDDFGAYVNGGPKMQALNNVLEAGKNVTNIISGMALINTMQQRWAAKALAQRLTEAAMRGGGLTEKKLAYLGIEPAMWQRIQTQVKQHVSWDQGWSGKLAMHNFDQWTDAQARATYQMALGRWARKTIQESDIGQMHRWFSAPFVRLLTQFRTFMFGAWEKQFLHGLHMRDWSTFVGFMSSVVFGGAGYVVQAKLRNQFRSDEEKVNERQFSPIEIAKASWARSGWSSILPMMIDTGALALGQDPMFNFRASALPSNVLLGNPTFSLLDNLKDFGKGVAAPILEGRPPSQQEIRAGMQMVPFQNFIPILNGINAAIRNLPERTPKN